MARVRRGPRQVGKFSSCGSSGMKRSISSTKCRNRKRVVVEPTIVAERPFHEVGEVMNVELIEV
jgi:hypothetical protein